ncbi:MAG TPA: Maf family nucleotide pyrophosphatase [Nocardioidaceae bacterium]|nr:Maf family nucleotide pyrophosphatase [Nocardioidaceae bacterium]
MTELILASASPARLATLRRAGVEPTVVVSGVDETAYRGGTPEELALALAVAKAERVAATVTEGVVVACDSVLDVDGEAFGKPADAAAAAQRWHLLRGRSADLVTGHCVIEVAAHRQRAAAARSRVVFAAISDAEIDAYVATGEPLVAAGAFTIDGLGAPFVEAVYGDPHNVIGISLPLLRRMLADLGIAWISLWRSDQTADPSGRRR